MLHSVRRDSGAPLIISHWWPNPSSGTGREINEEKWREPDSIKCLCADLPWSSPARQRHDTTCCRYTICKNKGPNINKWLFFLNIFLIFAFLRVFEHCVVSWAVCVCVVFQCCLIRGAPCVGTGCWKWSRGSVSLCFIQQALSWRP